MKKVLIDTDVLIDYTKGYDRWLGKLLSQQASGDVELYVSVVNVTEFFSDRKLENAALLSQAKEFIGLFTSLDITKQISHRAAAYIRGGQVSYLGDALIGSTCTTHDLSLATRNTKHFRKIVEIQFF